MGILSGLFNVPVLGGILKTGAIITGHILGLPQTVIQPVADMIGKVSGAS